MMLVCQARPARLCEVLVTGTPAVMTMSINAPISVFCFPSAFLLYSKHCAEWYYKQH